MIDILIKFCIHINTDDTAKELFMLLLLTNFEAKSMKI